MATCGSTCAATHLKPQGVPIELRLRFGHCAERDEGAKVMCDGLALHDAYERGDLAALKLGEPPDFPNCRGPQGGGEIILEYAIYHSPLAYIRALLELGADPNYQTTPGSRR